MSIVIRARRRRRAVGPIVFVGYDVAGADDRYLTSGGDVYQVRS